MANNERIFSDVYFDGLNLSEEARQVTNEAAGVMRQWINDSVKGLTTKFVEAHEKAIADMDASTKEIMSAMDEHLQKLNELEASLKPAGTALSDVDFKTKADQLIKEVDAMKQDLAARKAKAEQAGKLTMTLLKTGLKATGIPVPV